MKRIAVLLEEVKLSSRQNNKNPTIEHQFILDEPLKNIEISNSFIFLKHSSYELLCIRHQITK
jgi:hypothetical protein